MAVIIGDNFSNNEDNGDPLDGTSGNDTIYGYAGNDDLFGYGGDDMLYGGSGDDVLFGGSGVNYLYGDAIDEESDGNPGDDLFVMGTRGGKSSDDIIGDFDLGHDGIDLSDWGVSDFNQILALLTADSRGDALLNAAYGGKNHFLTIEGVDPGELESGDFVYTDRGARDIGGTSSKDTLFGSRSGDEIRGNGGDDKILGGKGDDDLFGGSGKDKIWGGAGSDLMTGGSKSDTFVFQSASDMKSSTGLDHITDFDSGYDLIDFRGVDADSTFSGNQDFTWIGKQSFISDNPGELRYYYSGDNTIVAGNTDNDSAAEFKLVLEGRMKLYADDFLG